MNTIISILIQQNISKNILKQTFRNTSPTLEHILSKLPDKKLNRSTPRKIEKNIFPKTTSEVEKLFKDILPYIINIEETHDEY